jgi:hypothetical protein
MGSQLPTFRSPAAGRHGGRFNDQLRETLGADVRSGLTDRVA